MQCLAAGFVGQEMDVLEVGFDAVELLLWQLVECSRNRLDLRFLQARDIEINTRRLEILVEERVRCRAQKRFQGILAGHHYSFQISTTLDRSRLLARGSQESQDRKGAMAAWPALRRRPDRARVRPARPPGAGASRNVQQRRIVFSCEVSADKP